MKKIFISLITTILLLSIIPFNTAFKVKANAYYSYGCNSDEFELSYIENDGSFTKVSCHSNFDEAKKAMKANKDYVVRYSKSYSPTMIVAMNEGLAYTYPGRSNSSTMNIYQNVIARDDSRYKRTFVANHYEMTYVDTLGSDYYDIKSNGKGYIRVVLNGFEGFTDLEYTDLVPFKFINNNIPIWLGGKNVYEAEDPFLVKVHQNYYMIEKNDNYYDMSFHYYRAYPTGSNNGADALHSKYIVDNAKNYIDAGMQVGVKYYSNDGINYYSDYNLKNKVATVYNYYQFLPLRTHTNLTVEDFDNYIAKLKGDASILLGQGKYFLRGQNAYGANALIVYAMACLESAYGTSGYARNRNNLFGWSAYDDSPDDASSFSSVKVCVYEQMGRNLNWFLDFTNRRYFGYAVGNKGSGINVQYASDPYWGIKIASISYNIDKFANNYNGNLKDYNTYTLAFVKDNYNDVIYSNNIKWDSKFYKANTGNNVLFSGQYGSHYQKDLIVALLSKSGTRYKVQSINPLENGELVTRDGILDYDWDNSIAYIEEADVIQLNNKPIEPDIPPREDPTYAPLVSFREVKLNANTLTVSGVGAIQGMDFINKNDIKHTINFKSIETDKTIYTIDLDTIDSDGYSNNDNYDYKYTGFRKDIDLNNLTNGSYYVQLVTKNKDKTISTYLYTPNKEYRSISNTLNNTTYRVRMNDNYNYRFEIDVLSLPEELYMSNINKPSARPSLLSLDSIYLNNEGNLEIQGHGFMYYLDYNNPSNITYELYLVDSYNNFIKLDTNLYDDGVDYTSELQSKYDLSNICFKATGNISSLKEGNYVIYVKMSNGNNIDINELINYGFDLNSIDLNGYHYALNTAKLRKRIELKVTKGE